MMQAVHTRRARQPVAAPLRGYCTACTARPSPWTCGPSAPTGGATPTWTSARSLRRPRLKPGCTSSADVYHELMRPGCYQGMISIWDPLHAHDHHACPPHDGLGLEDDQLNQPEKSVTRHCGYTGPASCNARPIMWSLQCQAAAAAALLCSYAEVP